MEIKLCCVGKLKDAFYVDACAEYEKRLSRYCTLRLAEVADEKTPERLSPAQAKAAMAREGERLLAAIGERERVIALCIGGQTPSSEDFAAKLALWRDNAVTPCFVIGGSLGLGDAVLARADERLSLSALTFPHRLARLILLEQLYRAEKILHNETYHK